jgi:hypothetical protein
MSRVPFWPTLLLATACVVTVPAAAAAQTAPHPPAASASGLRIQALQSGFVVAPDARFTEVNGRQATLAGAYAGWLTDRTFFIGAAGYWLANRDDDFRMQYGGALVRWTFRGDRALALSTGLVAGLGDATLARPYGEVFGTPPATVTAASGRDGRIRFGGGPAVTAATPVRVHDTFVLAEPQLHAVWTMAPWLRLTAGVGYRVVGATDLLSDQLRGPSGSVAVQFGGR